MTGWCPYKTGTLGEQECHFDGYCYECEHYRGDIISRREALYAVKEFQHSAKEWRDEQEADSNLWHRADSAIASAIEIGLRIKKIPSAHCNQLATNLQPTCNQLQEPYKEIE